MGHETFEICIIRRSVPCKEISILHSVPFSTIPLIKVDQSNKCIKCTHGDGILSRLHPSSVSHTAEKTRSSQVFFSASIVPFNYYISIKSFSRHHTRVWQCRQWVDSVLYELCDASRRNESCTCAANNIYCKPIVSSSLPVRMNTSTVSQWLAESGASTWEVIAGCSWLVLKLRRYILFIKIQFIKVTHEIQIKFFFFKKIAYQVCIYLTIGTNKNSQNLYSIIINMSRK